MKKHKRSHTGEKPFKCEEMGCDYQATKREYLMLHKDKVHGGSVGQQGPLPVELVEEVVRPIIDEEEGGVLAETGRTGKRKEHWI